MALSRATSTHTVVQLKASQIVLALRRKSKIIMQLAQILPRRHAIQQQVWLFTQPKFPGENDLKGLSRHPKSAFQKACYMPCGSQVICLPASCEARHDWMGSMQCGEGGYSVSGSRNEYSSTCVHRQLKLEIIIKTFPEVLRKRNAL